MSLMNEASNLDFNNVGNWPILFRATAILIVCCVVLGAGFYLDTMEQLDLLEKTRAKESNLKKTFEDKQAHAANLDAYREQMKEMELKFGELLLKLPSKTEIAELLVDISRVGLLSGLEFELFQPGAEVHKDFYAKFPINLRVRGTYHQLGGFASGIAALPRIVTLHNLSISNAKGGNLIMTATANTYRYIDKKEQRSMKKKRKRKTR
jgi:type IV pilus assembly protein PilO